MTDPVAQTLSLQELHRDKRGTITGGPEFVYRHDARMRKLGRRPRFLQKAFEDLRVRGLVRMQELQCNIAIEASIVRDEDEPKGAFTKFLSELVLPDGIA